MAEKEPSVFSVPLADAVTTTGVDDDSGKAGIFSVAHAPVRKTENKDTVIPKKKSRGFFLCTIFPLRHLPAFISMTAVIRPSEMIIVNVFQPLESS